MKRPIPIGVEFYKQMIDRNYYYIDKTLLIRDLLDSHTIVSLFTRPRRFGKTLALNMLKTFFEDERDADGEKIDNRCYFEGKKIEAAGDAYMSEQGKYPVIFLTLKSARQPEFDMAYSVLMQGIREEFRRHDYVLKGSALNDTEKTRFRLIYEGKAQAGDGDLTGISVSLPEKIPWPGHSYSAGRV